MEAEGLLHELPVEKYVATWGEQFAPMPEKHLHEATYVDDGVHAVIAPAKKLDAKFSNDSKIARALRYF